MKNFYYGLNQMELGIAQQLEQIRAVDAHEHLPSEKKRLDMQVDVFTIFDHYCRGDLEASGMSAADQEFVFKSKKSVIERWERLKPYYVNVRDTTYWRAAHIAMERFYGAEELNENTVETVTAAIQAANRPGLYHKVLSEACNLQTCLNQGADRSSDGLLTPVYWGLNQFRSRAEVMAYSSVLGKDISSIDDIVDAGRMVIDSIKNRGGVGFKFLVFPMRKPDIDQARDLLVNVRTGRVSVLPQQNPLADLFFDAALRRVAEVDITAAIHTGYWRDFRELNPVHAIWMLDNYKNVRFDLYHLGYPYVRESIMLGKSRANVWLNLCWTYIISEKFAFEALSEVLDMVPNNKIIGFGGDYMIVEKVFGHLTLARKTIARALSERIRSGIISTERAMDIADMILRVNPTELYRVNQEKS